MKKLSFACIVAFVIGCTSTFGQDIFYKNYTWDAIPVVPRDTCIDTSDHAIYLIDKIVLQYYFNENNEFSMVETVHTKVLIRDKQGIDDFNKVEINVDTSSDILSLMARAVSKTGEVVVFNKDNIKEIKDEENNVSKIFALDGLTEGGVAEVLYTINRTPTIWGRKFFQSEYPRLTAEFKMICPDFLELAMHSVNGFPDAPGRLMDKQRTYVAMAKNIPGIKSESYSNYRSNLQMIEYTISVNHNKSESRIYDNKQAAQHYWEFYNDIQSSETKEIKSIIKSAGVNKNMSTEEKIRAIDSYIKTNFLVVEYISGFDKKDISRLIQIKVLDKEACTKLFVGVMKELGIDYQIVLTCNRYVKSISRDFESWNNLDETLLYFPESNGYLCPYNVFSRYKLNPYLLAGTDGLFIKKLEYQGMESGVGKIQNIPALPSEQSIDSLEVSVALPADFNDAIYNVTYRLTGYTAYYFLQAYSTSEDNKKEETALPYMKLMSDDCDVNEMRIENASEASQFFLKPVVISAKVTTNAPIEKAGDKFLFNIGKLIGQQEHLYDEQERHLPIEIEYQHRFVRKLSIEIPEGFKVTNPEILAMEKVYSSNGKSCASFKSTYEIVGRKIIVTIWENYDMLKAPVADYIPFRDVINAAADFNKLTLIIVKDIK